MIPTGHLRDVLSSFNYFLMSSLTFVAMGFFHFCNLFDIFSCSIYIYEQEARIKGNQGSFPIISHSDQVYRRPMIM